MNFSTLGIVGDANSTAGRLFLPLSRSDARAFLSRDRGGCSPCPTTMDILSVIPMNNNLIGELAASWQGMELSVEPRLGETLPADRVKQKVVKEMAMQ